MSIQRTDSHVHEMLHQGLRRQKPTVGFTDADSFLLSRIYTHNLFSSPPPCRGLTRILQLLLPKPVAAYNLS